MKADLRAATTPQPDVLARVGALGHDMTCTNDTNNRWIAAVAVVVTALTVMLACAAPQASASKSQWSLFEDHVYLVRSGPQVREDTLDEIRNLGADTLRIEVKWSEVAPD